MRGSMAPEPKTMQTVKRKSTTIAASLPAEAGRTRRVASLAAEVRVMQTIRRRTTRVASLAAEVRVMQTIRRRTTRVASQAAEVRVMQTIRRRTTRAASEVEAMGMIIHTMTRVAVVVSEMGVLQTIPLKTMWVASLAAEAKAMQMINTTTKVALLEAKAEATPTANVRKAALPEAKVGALAANLMRRGVSPAVEVETTSAMKTTTMTMAVLQEATVEVLKGVKTIPGVGTKTVIPGATMKKTTRTTTRNQAPVGAEVAPMMMGAIPRKTKLHQYIDLLLLRLCISWTTLLLGCR
jgi:hypothetical protein